MVLAAALSGCEESGIEVNEETASFEWPFTVSTGRIECRNGGEVVFQANDTIYSINGTADAFADQRGYSDVSPIWKDSPTLEGLKISIGPIISIGLEQC